PSPRAGARAGSSAGADAAGAGGQASSSRSSAAARCWWTCTCWVAQAQTAEVGTLNGLVELRQEVAPRGSFRLPRRTGMDGMLRRRGGVLERLLHDGEEPVVVRIAQPAPDRVLFGARARTRTAAAYGIARMRFALGV